MGIRRRHDAAPLKAIHEHERVGVTDLQMPLQQRLGRLAVSQDQCFGGIEQVVVGVVVNHGSFRCKLR